MTGAPPLGLGRPKILVNCAASADGRLAYAGGRRALLSGPDDLRRVHEIRSEVDAIVVGVGTVIADDPSLRVKWELLGRAPGREPLRVVLDAHGRTPPSAKVLTPPPPTLIVTGASITRRWPDSVQVFRGPGDRTEIPLLWGELARRGVRSVLVEGGADVLSRVLRSGQFDRFTVYVAPVLIGGTSAPPLMSGPDAAVPAGIVPLRLERSERIAEGVLLTYVPAP